MAGYSGTPLPRKLGIKPGMTVSIVDAPDEFGLSSDEMPDDVDTRPGDGPADIYLIFADHVASAVANFSRVMRSLPPNGSIWMAWPKKSSGVETDITENTLRELFLSTGMVDNKVCSIDETWSGLRFVVRKENRAGWPPKG